VGTQSALEGLTFHGTDPGGDAFMCLDLDFESSARTEAIDRPTDHGEFDTPVLRGAMLITGSGWARASSMAALRAMRTQFRGLLADGRSGLFTFDEDGSELEMTVRLYGQPRFKFRGSTLRADWSFKFRAANPRMYGVTHTYGPDAAVSSIQHDGNFPASPVLTVAGSDGGGYTLTGPGGRLVTVTEPLVTGHPHTIDFATGGLYVDGARVLGGVSVYQPWAVPAGVDVSCSVDAGTVQVEVRDTFL